MSVWLKRRVVMWCALTVLLGGGWWFSSARAQSEREAPPAKTPEAAAANFMGLMATATDGNRAYGTLLAFRQLEQAISRVQRQKMEKHDPNTSQNFIGILLLEMASMQHIQDYKGKVIDQSEGKAVVELQKAEPSAPPPIVCVAEDGGWRVDLFGTYAKWKGLSDMDRDLLVANLTGEVSPLPATNPEVMVLINRVRENARRASCQSNLKQVSLGMMQYVQDYDEKLPPAREWADVLQPYVMSQVIFRCPSVPDKNGFGYAFNSRLSGKDYNLVSQPAQMVTIYETTDLRWNAYGLGEKPAFRHFDGANYAFADGHIKWFQKERIPQFTFRP